MGFYGFRFFRNAKNSCSCILRFARRIVDRAYACSLRVSSSRQLVNAKQKYFAILGGAHDCDCWQQNTRTILRLILAAFQGFLPLLRQTSRPKTFSNAPLVTITAPTITLNKVVSIWKPNRRNSCKRTNPKAAAL